MIGAKASILLLAAAVAVLGLLRTDLFTSVSPATAKTEIAFWNGFTGPDGRVMLGIVREFNAAETGSGAGHVTMQRMDWGTYYNKLLVTNADGRGPEVFVVTASYLPRMVRAGFVSDVDEVFDERAGGVPASDFDGFVLDQVRYDGRLKGLPLDVHPQGLYCNAEMLREAGCVDAAGNPRAPVGAAEFFEVARKLKSASGSSGPRWGFSYTLFQNNFLSLLPQFGGSLMDLAGNPTLDSAGAVAALEAMTRVVREQGLAPEPEGTLGWTGFRQKRVAMVWDGIYMLGDLKRLDGLAYLAAPIPQLGPYPGVHGDSHVVCIRTGLDPARRAAAVRLVRFLSARSLDWADAGQVPARISARHTARFEAMTVQYEFAKQLSYVRYPPRTPIQIELLTEVNTAVERALRGRATPAEALKDAQENAVRFVARERQERGDAAGGARP